MDEKDGVPRAVVERGGAFETARVAKVTPSTLRLTGGWPEGGFAKAATLVVGALEVQTRVLESGAGYVLLGPLTATTWPADLQRALSPRS